MKSNDKHLRRGHSAFSGVLSLDASYFPVDVDLASQTVFFRNVTRQSLAEQAFLDGRTVFWTSDSIAQPFSDIELIRATQPWRFIVHIGFCGSTLLANVLDQPGRSLVLREPHVLAALAHQADSSSAVDQFLWKTSHLLHRPFSPLESIVIKPTNWFNNLVPRLADAPETVFPLFMSSSAEDYLIAAFRGGNERISFIVRLAAHLAERLEQGLMLWESAADASLHPLERVARVILLARNLQHRLFQQAMKKGRWTNDRLVSLSDLIEDLPSVAWKVSKLLELELDQERLEERCAEVASRNVKSNNDFYSSQARLMEDKALRRKFEVHFMAALDWASYHIADQDIALRG